MQVEGFSGGVTVCCSTVLINLTAENGGPGKTVKNKQPGNQ